MSSSASQDFDLDRIVADLKQLIREGLSAAAKVKRFPTLGNLVLVTQEQLTNDDLGRVVAAERIVVRAIETLEGSPVHRPLQTLLGLRSSLLGTLAKQRRAAAARELGSDPGTFNRHDEPRLLRLLARRIYELETEARIRADRIGLRPSISELKANWMQRFHHYHRVKGILEQLRLDLIAVLLTQESVPDEQGRVDYTDASLWRYASYLVALEDFSRELGGEWVMPAPQADAEARTTVDLLLWHGPFNERGRSWLRATVQQDLTRELYHFARHLRDEPSAAEMLGLWEQWLESCRCDSEQIDANCRPHQVIGQSERLCLVIEDQWTQVRHQLDLPSEPPPES